MLVYRTIKNVLSYFYLVAIEPFCPAEKELALLTAKYHRMQADLNKYSGKQLSAVYWNKLRSDDADTALDTLTYIFVVTPTYTRPVQKAELTRLVQTFMLVSKLHWIVVEDRDSRSSLVSNLLKNSGVSYTHLVSLTPAVDKLQDSDPNWLKPRGVNQRNTALEWLRSSDNNISRTGVLYFADDDNTYDIKLFNEVSLKRLPAQLVIICDNHYLCTRSSAPI